MPPKRTPAIIRWKRKAPIGAPDECWLWPHGRKENGYGVFMGDAQRNVHAHRFAYELAFGPIPPGMQIDHVCRNRACVNPHHLEVVTQHENLMRSELTIPARNAKKQRCPYGHRYAARRCRDGSRRCNECARIRNAEARSQLRPGMSAGVLERIAAKVRAEAVA